MKCKTCKDTKRVISDGAWNHTLQEHVACPDCKENPNDPRTRDEGYR